MDSVINHWVRIRNHSLIKDGVPVAVENITGPDDVYRSLGFSYPKYFKMDSLSKWAWLGAECLLGNGDSSLYEGLDKNKIGIVLMTAHGCLEVDKRYQDTMQDIASPALFVYTLPNIMLGEICIRHGFKGEQACMVSDVFDYEELGFWVKDLLAEKGMDTCLCGWVDVQNGKEDVSMFWIRKETGYLMQNVDMWKLYNR